MTPPNLIQNNAEQIYLYRLTHNIEGSDDNDWELANVHKREYNDLKLEEFCSRVFSNTLGD